MGRREENDGPILQIVKRYTESGDGAEPFNLSEMLRDLSGSELSLMTEYATEFLEDISRMDDAKVGDYAKATMAVMWASDARWMSGKQGSGVVEQLKHVADYMFPMAVLTRLVASERAGQIAPIGVWGVFDIGVGEELAIFVAERRYMRSH